MSFRKLQMAYRNCPNTNNSIFYKKNFILNKRKEKREIEKYKRDIIKDSRETLKEKQKNRPEFKLLREYKSGIWNLHLVNKGATAINVSREITSNNSNAKIYVLKKPKKNIENEGHISYSIEFAKSVLDGDIASVKDEPWVEIIITYSDVLQENYYEQRLHGNDIEFFLAEPKEISKK